MKAFAERSPIAIGAVGVALTAGLVVAALNYDKLPVFNTSRNYSAYFAEAGGLVAGAPVQVSGFQVGAVTDVALDGPRVLVKFDVANNVRLGDRAEAAVRTKSVLGAKVLQIEPRGNGQLSGPIPLDRTRSAYQLPDALGDLANTISGLDTKQVSESLSVLASTFADTPPELKVAVQGVARFSDTLNARDDRLRNLLANANKATQVLAQRSDQIVTLIANTDALLVALQSQSDGLDHISNDIAAVTQQIRGFITDNRATLKPALVKLNDVLTIVDNRKERIQKSIKMVNRYALSLGESSATGPFFNAYVANLFPGQFIQPFVDAAFSDLGLDPNVLLPSQRTDAPVGQPGTPPLPVPYPRTGQGGEPNLTLPDAITGNPGDPRYPYREPLPAPPPGGPPPGPPAESAPGELTGPLFDPGEPSPVLQPGSGPAGPAPGPAPEAGR
jgi:phospholipid/cholesterol/gamma-HCH transport system substrate-binding protein